MGMAAIATFVRLLESVTTVEDFSAAMVEICALLGVQYFALTHHVDITKVGKAIRVHNYPDRWADHYDRNALGVSDPVHRASHVTSVGFRWSKMDQMIALTAADRRMLSDGRDQGIGDGFTIPANVPGEARGSCSFASDAGRSMCESNLPLAQLAGAFAFEGARRLWSARSLPADIPAPVLTDRQRDCIMWAARGKTDWEVSRILGISEETVIRHIKQARERYGVPKRTLLAIRTLYDGTLCFDDILDPGYALFWE